MTKPVPPSVVTRAAEIFGGAPEVGTRNDFVSWADFVEVFSLYLQETQPFDRIYGTDRYKVEGHISGHCPHCRLVIFKGTNYKKKSILVDRNGAIHQCGNKKKGGPHEWGF